MGPWLLLAGGLILVLAAGGKAMASSGPILRVASGPAVVPITHRRVFWKLHKKSKEPLHRIEVVEQPTMLALEASRRLGMKNVIPIDTWTLATVIASEASDPRAKIAIAWATKNMAQKMGRSIYSWVAPKGKFGDQRTNSYASTRFAPSKIDLEIAVGVRSGTIKDPTGGAIQWDSPAAQIALIQRREPGYDPSNTPDSVARSRRESGRRLVTLPGIDPNYLRLWA